LRAGGDTGLVRLRRSLLPLALAAALAAALSGCVGGTDAVDQSAGDFHFVAGTGRGQLIPAADRKTGPRITGDLLSGGAFDPSSVRGKVVVLNFWAHWCAPCRVEVPDLQAAYDDTRASGVAFLGVAVQDTKQEADAFLTNHKVSYPSLFDPNGKVALRFRDFPQAGLPYTIVLDRQGRVAGVYLTPLLREDIEPVVRRLAAEQ
jgi:thiol-disulfide isomerase/thioredoxin